MRRRLILAFAATAAFAARASRADEPKKKKGGGADFITFPTLTATILRGSGRRGVLTVEAGLDVPDAALRDRAEASQPRLLDAYDRFLQSYAANAGSGAPPNPDLIAQALQRATDQVLGAPGARLLLGTILVN